MFPITTPKADTRKATKCFAKSISDRNCGQHWCHRSSEVKAWACETVKGINDPRQEKNTNERSATNGKRRALTFNQTSHNLCGGKADNQQQTSDRESCGQRYLNGTH